MSSPKNVTQAERIALVREKFPKCQAILRFPIYRNSTVYGSDEPYAVADVLVQAVWETRAGVKMAAIEHPMHGRVNLAFDPNAQSVSDQVWLILRDAEVMPVPTAETLRDEAVAAVNRMWSDAWDNAAEMKSAIGHMHTDLAALQDRVSALPGLDAHRALEAAMSALERRMGDVLKRADSVLASAEKKLTDIRAPLDQGLREVHERINALDALLRLLAEPTASPAPVVGALPAPVEAIDTEPDASEVRVPKAMRQDIADLEDAKTNYGTARGIAKRHELELPPAGTALADVKTFLLSQLRERMNAEG